MNLAQEVGRNAALRLSERCSKRRAVDVAARYARQLVVEQELDRERV